MNIEEQVRVFFSIHGKHDLPGDRAAFLEYRYLDQGLIDSFGIVSLIGEMEEKCDIHFSAEDLESYEFQSIGGLISIIERLRGSPK